MSKVTYNVGDKVFAKVKGYPPWPAQIDGDTGKKKYNVVFYGTKEVGVIKVEDISYYIENKGNIVKKYLKRAGYGTAVTEIEAAIEKDGGDGSGKTLSDISSETNTILTTASTPSEKKGIKRKSSISNSEIPPKKSLSRRKSVTNGNKELEGDLSDNSTLKSPRRKSTLQEESMEVVLEEPVAKKARRKSTLPESDSTSGNDVKTNEENEEAINNTTEISTVSKENIENTQNDKIEDKEQSKETEETVKDTENSPIKNNIVTEQMLNNNILYAEHVRKNTDLYQDKTVEDRGDNKDHIFPVKLPEGSICGLKLHKDWPLDYKKEYDRAMYDEKISKMLLEIKDQIGNGNTTIKEINTFEVIPDLNMNNDDLNEIIYTKDIESKRRRLDRLKREADLVTWDSKIKMNLSLDRALLDEALDCLNEFNEIEKGLDVLMFKKHPHVLDTVRRLRKYVGNVVEWKMDGEELDYFTKKAEKIRYEAEKIFTKLKNVIKIEDPKPTFWDAFLETVSDFRSQCKNLSDLDILVLCAEPNSRQAFLDKLDESTEPDVEN